MTKHWTVFEAPSLPNLQQLKTFSGLFASRAEFGVPPVVSLSFHWPLFRSMAKQDIPGGTNKSLRTQLLWQLSLVRSCAWGRLWYPSAEGVGVTRSEEKSPTWDFSQPQLDRAQDWWGMETFFAITSIPLLPHGEQRGMPTCITSDSEQTQGTLLNKPHDQLWLVLGLALRSALTHLYGTSAREAGLKTQHVSFQRINTWQSIPKRVSLPEVMRHQVGPKIPCCYGCRLL